MEKQSKNLQIERDEVLNPCLSLCYKLWTANIILQYRRLDVFDKTHINGSPDIEIWVPMGDLVLILCAECKKPVGGVVSDSQSDYRDKYASFKNVQYEIITSVDQLDYLIRKLSDVKVEMDDFQNFQCEPIIEKPGSDI
jgi:hypothetical protein